MTMTPVDLGDSLARLVWESFTDFLESAPVATTTGPDGEPTPDLIAEELLILFLWVHTRACQQALAPRTDAGILKDTLDAMHRAVFEDMEAHGAARDALPLFEQRVSARYSEYYAAAGRGDQRIGEVAARRVSGKRTADPAFRAALAEAALVAAGPLRDYLDDVDITP